MQVLQILFLLINSFTYCRIQHTIISQRSSNTASKLSWKMARPRVFLQVLFILTWNIFYQPDYGAALGTALVQ